MRLLLDTCVLYPTVMREVLLGAARAGFYTPLWSARILEEWARASEKLGPVGRVQAQSEITLLRTAWPDAEVSPAQGLEDRLWLPDPADIHVLASAIRGNAEWIVTLNAKDFPRHILAEEGLNRIDPDKLLHGFWTEDPEAMAKVVGEVLAEANGLSDREWDVRALLKKARLPRLGKALKA